jgi:hypothetical protein
MADEIRVSGIAAKMVKALAAIDAVEKKGRNQAQSYAYVRATDVANEVRRALHESGIAFTYQVLTERFWETERLDKSSGKPIGMNYFCSLHVQGTFTDEVTGQSLSSSSIGWGADSQDKAPYKAMTGALKYLLRTTFLIPDELDPENDAMEKKVRAEVERQKRANPAPTAAEVFHLPTPAAAVPPELDWSYNKTTGVLICRIVDARKSKRKTGSGTVVAVQINQTIDDRNLAYYFHNTHQDALVAAKGKIAKLIIDATGNTISITDVLELDGEPVAKPAESSQTQARLLASVLDVSESELIEMHTGYCNSNWAMTLDNLQRMKVAREEVTE